jgi:hypothetical protein
MPSDDAGQHRAVLPVSAEAATARTVDDPLFCRHGLDLPVVDQAEPPVRQEEHVARVAVACSAVPPSG